MSHKKYYAVARGRNPGIYTEWYGDQGAEVQVNGFEGARYKGFATLQEAQRWLKGDSNNILSFQLPEMNLVEGALPVEAMPAEETEPTDENVVIYTDGGCIGNPGPGGYGIVLYNAGRRMELSGGFRWTTNNRMELTACIVALQALKVDLPVIMHSDSRYVVNGITKGWAKRWRSRGWMRNHTNKAENADLWELLLPLCEEYRVDFRWVRGHAGSPDNERCDQLAMQAAQQPGLPPDQGYEASNPFRINSERS